MIGDYVTSVKAHLYDRVSSPLLGAFTLSWIIWNYDFLFVVFSSHSYIEKIDYVNNILYTSIYEHAKFWLLYPLITTVFLVFVYPFPAKFVYEFWRKRQKELKDIRQKIDDEELLTVEESRNLKRLLFEAEKSHEDMLERSAQEKVVLEDRVAELEREVAAKDGHVHDLRDRVKELEEKRVDAHSDRLELLLQVAKNGGDAKQKDLISKMDWSKDKVLFHIDDAVKSQQLSLETVGKENIVHLKHEGRRVLVNENLV